MNKVHKDLNNLVQELPYMFPLDKLDKKAKERQLTDIKSAIAVIFNDNKKVLLGTSNSKDSRMGKLCFPGGGVNPGEDIYQAAEREAKEETGLIVKSIPNSQIILPSNPQVVFIKCKFVDGNIQPNFEFFNLYWYDLDSLPIEQIYANNVQVLQLMK